MSLNIVKGNMYREILGRNLTHTWNPIKGRCSFDCFYCYMKKWGELKAPRLDESEFKTDLGSDNFIFVGSSIDMWHENIPEEWIKSTMNYINKFPDNKYLFQSKAPNMFVWWYYNYPESLKNNIIFATTIESNRHYPNISKAPHPVTRMGGIRKLHSQGFKTMVTVEPVLDFDLDDFIGMLKYTLADQINIGAVTGGHKLPEPSKNKLQALIEALKPHLKSNIKRLL